MLNKKLDKKLTEAGFEKVFCPTCGCISMAYCYESRYITVRYQYDKEIGGEMPVIGCRNTRARCLACLTEFKWVEPRIGHYIKKERKKENKVT